MFFFNSFYFLFTYTVTFINFLYNWNLWKNFPLAVPGDGLLGLSLGAVARRGPPNSGGGGRADQLGWGT